MIQMYELKEIDMRIKSIKNLLIVVFSSLFLLVADTSIAKDKDTFFWDPATTSGKVALAAAGTALVAGGILAALFSSKHHTDRTGAVSTIAFVDQIPIWTDMNVNATQTNIYTVQNISDVIFNNLTINTADFTSPLSLTTTCGSSLAPHATCTITITVSPTAPTSIDKILTVGNSLQTITSEIKFDVQSLAIVHKDSVEMMYAYPGDTTNGSVELQNTSNQNLTFHTGLFFTINAPAGFTLVEDPAHDLDPQACKNVNTLSPNQTCKFYYKYTNNFSSTNPNINPGTVSGANVSIDFRYDDPSGDVDLKYQFQLYAPSLRWFLQMPQNVTGFNSLPINGANEQTISDVGDPVTVSGGKIYIGTTAGLAVSRDLGESWRVYTTGNGIGVNTFSAGSNSRSAIRGIATALPNNVYLATAEGLAISHDGGANFVTKTTDNGLASNQVNGVYALDAEHIYAATQNGFSISTDGGETFHPPASGPTTGVILEVYATDPQHIYVAAAANNGLWITPDGGITFTHPITGVTISKVFVDSYAIYAAGASTGLYVSTNGGNSFTQITGRGLGSNIIRSVYADATQVYVATSAGLSIIAKSDLLNPAVNFSTKTTGNGLGSNNIQQVYADATHIYAATAVVSTTIPGGFSISTDLSGNSFTNKTSQGTLCYSSGGATFSGVNKAVALADNIYVATDNCFAISHNGGLSFTNYTTSTTPALPSNLVFGVSSPIQISGTQNRVYAATSNGLSIITDDTTSVPTFVTKNSGDGLPSNSLFGVYALDANNFFVATANGLSVSNNGGVGFANYLAGVNLLDVFALDTNHIYAGSNSNGLYITTNGGVSFTPYTTAQGLGSNTVNGVYALDTNRIYAATNGGLSLNLNFDTTPTIFTNKTIADGLGSNILKGVYVDAAGIIYTADSLVFAISTDNTGTQFVQYNFLSGLDLGNGDSKSVYIDPTNKLYIGTSLTGLFYTKLVAGP